MKRWEIIEGFFSEEDKEFGEKLKEKRMKKCKNEGHCRENFKYDGRYEFLDFGIVRFFGMCFVCNRKGWEDFEYIRTKFGEIKKKEQVK